MLKIVDLTCCFASRSLFKEATLITRHYNCLQFEFEYRYIKSVSLPYFIMRNKYLVRTFILCL